MLRQIFKDISEYLSPEEKRQFLDILEKYKKKRIPLIVPLGFLKNIAQKYKRNGWQKYLNPYPKELIDFNLSALQKSE